jgi:DNA-directed RNA polymerase beta' subunit
MLLMLFCEMKSEFLQEAVDSLIDNSIRHGNASQSAVNQSQRRALKSLSDNLERQARIVPS